MSERARNEELVRAGFDAFNRGELELLVRLFDPEVVAYIAPPLANAGRWQGHDGFIRMVTSWTEAFASLTNTVTALHHPDPNHVIAEVHQRAVGAGSGAPVEMMIAYLFEIRDDRIVRLHLYPDTRSALEAVG